LTVDELRRLLPETRELRVERYELPNLGAVNFVIRGLLGTGATSTLRLDTQAKALGEWLRARTIRVPRVLVEPPDSGEGLRTPPTCSIATTHPSSTPSPSSA
jgi:hypothetical protein